MNAPEQSPPVKGLAREMFLSPKRMVLSPRPLSSFLTTEHALSTSRSTRDISLVKTVRLPIKTGGDNHPGFEARTGCTTLKHIPPVFFSTIGGNPIGGSSRRARHFTEEKRAFVETFDFDAKIELATGAKNHIPNDF